MVERRLRPDAHEFLGADFDHLNARVVVKMGNDVVRHAVVPVLTVERRR
jgi:hypothetical protein